MVVLALSSLSTTQGAVKVSARRSSINGAALTRAVSNGSTTRMASDRPLWMPGRPAPSHLDGSMPGDFGFDPLGLASDPERLRWYRESELVHCRWAMLGVAGILGQEIFRPDVFWYDAPTKVQLPFNILGLVAVEFLLMHWVEVRRWQDWRNPGSVDQDPIFTNNKLPAHDVGYPGGVFAPFVPGNLDELKLKEVKNGRLAMLAFAGFTMGAQVYGKNPIALLGDHLADPLSNNIFSRAIVVPGSAVQVKCALPDSVQFEGISIPTPCLFPGLWP